MAEVSNPISHLDATALFGRIMASKAFGGSGSENQNCRGILDFLFRQRLEDQRGRFDTADLGEALGLNLNGAHGETNRDAIRLAVNKLRHKILPAFEKENPKEAFSLRVPKDGLRPPYHVEFVPKRSAAPVVDEFDGVSARLILGNRDKTTEWFRRAVCDSPDVLFATVGSQHTLDQITPWFEDGEVSAKHFRVLTCRPRSLEILSIINRSPPRKRRALHEETGPCVARLERT
jgi:hypothetical protein